MATIQIQPSEKRTLDRRRSKFTLPVWRVQESQGIGYTIRINTPLGTVCHLSGGLVSVSGVNRALTSRSRSSELSYLLGL